MAILRMALLAVLMALPLHHAGATGLLPELDTSSPLATYRTFLSEAQRLQRLYETYRAAPSVDGEIAVGRAMNRMADGLLDLSEYPPATRTKDGTFAVGYLADILHRLPAPSPDSIAHLGDATRWSVPGTQIRLRKVTQGPRMGEWLFAADTLERLPEFHAQIIAEPVLQPDVGVNWHQAQMYATGPLLARWRLENLPHWLRATMLGTPVWKALTQVTGLLLVVLAMLSWRGWVARRAPLLPPVRRRLLWLTVPLALAVLLTISHAIVVSQIIPTGMAADTGTIVVTVGLYAAAAWAVWLLCWLLVEAAIATPAIPDDSLDANLLRMLARVGAPLAAASVLIFGASDVGVPAVGLLAGVSIGGIALALAAQSTVENLFGGLSIFADRPFRVGDVIRFGDASGRVEAIGPRSARIRGADGTLTTVPNSDLAKMQVTNVTARTGSLFRHRFALPASTPRPRLAALLRLLRARMAELPVVEQSADMPRARLVGFTGDAVEVEVEARVRARTDAEFMEVQEALVLVLMNTVAEINEAEEAAPAPQARIGMAAGGGDAG